MALTQQQLDQVYADIMQRLSAAGESTPCLKADIAAAVAACDTWVESNQVSYNNALPAAFKANATASQKARLLSMVLAKRFGG